MRAPNGQRPIPPPAAKGMKRSHWLMVLGPLAAAALAKVLLAVGIITALVSVLSAMIGG